MNVHDFLNRYLEKRAGIMSSLKVRLRKRPVNPDPFPSNPIPKRRHKPSALPDVDISGVTEEQLIAASKKLRRNNLLRSQIDKKHKGKK